MKIIMMMVSLTLILFCTHNVYSHEPSAVNATYNGNTMQLTVNVEHKVENPKTHYIKKINVIQNGENIIVQRYKEQEDPNFQTFSAVVPGVKKDHSLIVEAVCNMNGSKEKRAKLTGF
jgi:desulfoferrodoxin (superoxide reductase-like protein)